MRYQGKLYRALNPVYAGEPLSGRGAALYGGRLNAKGVPALYTSLTIMTALKEASQVGNLQPTVLVSCDADLEDVFDCREDAALIRHGMDTAALADPTWHDEMKVSGGSADANIRASARPGWLSRTARQELRSGCDKR
jgi:RES domain-containing protein